MAMRPVLKVFAGSEETPVGGQTPLVAAYQHFRLDRMGNLASASTLEHYDWMVHPFLEWAARAGIGSLDNLKVDHVRVYRAGLTQRKTRTGRPLEGRTVLDSHKALMTFFRWAAEEEYQIDAKILKLKRPKAPEKESTVYHIKELRTILSHCNWNMPAEDLIIRLLVGSGLRLSELCGLSLSGPDGLPDLMADSLTRGRVELRVRWDAGAKGRKSRRVPITAKLAAAIKRYEARHRPRVECANLLINMYGRQYQRYGLDKVMDRLQERVGFRVHAHAFRHTFATVATQLGWNLEHLRAAMGHSDYKVLQGYVKLATERDLGPRKEWTEFILENPMLS
jgi:integrase/recombinase XerD